MFFSCRKRESPIERRGDERYRGDQRGAEGVRPNSFRNERVDRNERNERFERGRQSPRGQQRQERDRIDRRPEPEFRRERRDEAANPPEWRSRERAPGK